MRIGALQLAHHRDGPVGGVVHAEDDLHRSGVVLPTEGLKVVVEPLLTTVQGLEDGHRRRELGRGGAARRVHMGQGLASGKNGEPCAHERKAGQNIAERHQHAGDSLELGSAPGRR